VPKVTLSLKTLAEAQAEVKQVALTDLVVERLLELRRELLKAGIEISPRRWSDIIPVLQAQAWLSGRLAMVEDDLMVLHACLWQTPEQRPKVRQILAKVANPLRIQGVELVTAADAVVKEWQGVRAADSAERALVLAPRLKEAGEKLKGIVGKLKSDNRDATELEGHLSRLRESYNGMIRVLQ
jgi:hypothetical protein